MTDVEDLGAADGPWRVSAHLRILALGPSTDEAAAAAARAALAAEAAGIAVAASGAATPDDLNGSWLTRHAATDLLVVDVASTLEAPALGELRRAAGTDPMLVGMVPRFVVTAAEAPTWLACPRVTYAALPDLRCLYVKGSILATFAGSLDDAGPNALGDLGACLLHLNRFGFRIGIANHALVLLPADRVPIPASAGVEVPAGLRSALSNHRSSAPLRAERIMRGLDLAPDGRRTIAFDLSHVMARHSGTSELARALVDRAAAQWHEATIHVIATASAFAFHFGERHPAVQRVDPADARCFAVLIRIGQPFLWGEVESAVLRAPVLVFFLLDTIGLDCLAHAPDELDALWRFTLSEADGLLFNSAFTERQFARRFTIRPGLPRRASLHSLDLADYRATADRDSGGALPVDREAAEDVTETHLPVGTILVVGNAFSHKYTRETAALLAAAGTGERVVVLGLPPGVVEGVTAVPSGTLDARRLTALFHSARLVVYPSVYEGFGFPILEALAQRKPVLVRPLAPYDEIAAGLPERGNIHRFKDDAELLGLLRQEIRWVEPSGSIRTRNWDDASSDLRQVVAEAIADVSYDRVLRRIDTLRGRMAYMRVKALTPSEGSGEPSDDLDRLAGAAGRLAQKMVTRVGRRVPGAVLSLASRALRARRTP